jgi:hypothetical protein
MTDLRIDPSAAIAELARRGHDKVRALLPELPAGPASSTPRPSPTT